MLIQNDPDPALASLGKLIMSQESGTTSLKLDKSNYQVSYTTIPGVGWHMIAVVDQAELNAEVVRMSTALIAVTLVTLVIIAVAIVFIARYIRGNLKKIESFSKTAASGRFSDRIRIEAHDEFGLIANHLNFMVENMDKMSRESARMVESSNELISEITKSAHEVSVDSQDIVGSSSELVQDSVRQADALNDIADEADDIIAMTTENASKAESANTLAVQIRDVAQSGRTQMDNMVQAVKSISDSSANISKVIKAIDDIAFQTNILALNAAVEAARAGQHGKGFAVVAEEVRNLAAKSAGAAKETSSLISESVEKADVGAKIAGETSASFDDIVIGINRSAEIMGDISVANVKQAQAIKNITVQIQNAYEIAQKNAQTAGESSESAKKMSRQSELLDNLVHKYSE
jgi:methyl-accepting chemotaxis protein